MLSLFKSGSGQTISGLENADKVDGVDMARRMSYASAAEQKRRLQKRKPTKAGQVLDRRVSVPNFPTSEVLAPPTRYVSRNESAKFNVSNASAKAPERHVVTRASTVAPDRRSLSAIDSRRPVVDISPVAPIPRTIERRTTVAPPNPASTDKPQPHRHASIVYPDGKPLKIYDLHRASTDFTSSLPRRLIKKPKPRDSHDPTMSPFSAMKRRFSYSTTSENLLNNISEEEMKKISIQATRIPDFSSSQESSKIPSPAVKVTVVDRLPHQQPISRSRAPASMPTIQSRQNAPGQNIPPIPELAVNEEYLEEQEEVLSYLHNTLFSPPSPVPSPRSTISESDSGLPRTPTKQSEEMSKSASSDFLGSMMSEYPYLYPYLVDQDNAGTPPLIPKSGWIEPLTPPASSSSLHLVREVIEFPPSPPPSDGRHSREEYSRAVLEELASESESMKSVVDAINKASSPRSSFDSRSDNEEDGYFYVDEDSPETYLSHYNDDQCEWNSPMLRSGKPSFSGQALEPILSRSASCVSNATVFGDDGSIADVLAERRKRKPQLTPLVIAPIAPGQYGAPLQRRKHIRGVVKKSPSSAVPLTPVKVVEEEIVEYTPIEDGAKGWMRQRRVSRGGDWIVLEREILKRGAI
jgi:hypothetical protein